MLHLIYTRLWTKIMRDQGLIKFGEPVKKLLTQGMVCLATNRCEEHNWLYPTDVIDGRCKFCNRPVLAGRSEKMSKSKKNTVDPDEMIKVYGADTVRLFMLFAAPPEKDLEWSEAGTEGASRFLNRVWRIVYKWHEKLSGIIGEPQEFAAPARALRRKTHQTIKRVTHDIGDRMNFNTAIAALMELTNEIYAFDGSRTGDASDSDLFALKEAIEALVKMLAPFTPHIAEELWAAVGYDEITIASGWPMFDAELSKDEELEIPVQINGKLIARLTVSADATDEVLTRAALAHERVQARLQGREVIKTIVVPKRLVNLVAK